MAKSVKRKILRITLWTLGIVLALLLLLPFALYIPWVQNKAKDFACSYVKKSTGLDLSVEHIGISFPLDAELSGVLLLDQRGDTMVCAKSVTAGVQLMPLFKGEVKVGSASLKDAAYNMLAEDESMRLRAKLGECTVSGTDVDLKNCVVNIGDASLAHGNVELTLEPWKETHEEKDSTESEPWKINAGKIALNDIRYTMNMQPDMERLSVYVGAGELVGGKVDMENYEVKLERLTIDSLDCGYIYNSPQYITEFKASHPVDERIDDTPGDTATWTIRADSLSLDRAHVLYALKDRSPSRRGAIDENYLELNNIALGLSNVYNRGTTVDATLSRLAAAERSGLAITNGSGRFKMNDNSLDVIGFALDTRGSSLHATAHADLSLLDNNPSGIVHLKTAGHVDLNEVMAAMPSQTAELRKLPHVQPVRFNAEVDGTMQHLALTDVKVEMPGHIKASLDGTIDNPTDIKHLAANLDFAANVTNVNFVKQWLDPGMRDQINVPSLVATGKVRTQGSRYGGNVAVKLNRGGSMRASGSFNMANNSYDVDASTQSFPVQAFMPNLGVGNVTASVKAGGHGFDFLQPGTALQAQFNLGGVEYDKKHYGGLNGKVGLNGQNFEANLATSKGGKVDAKGRFDLNSNNYDLTANVHNLAVQDYAPQLGVGNVTASVKAHGNGFNILEAGNRTEAEVKLGSVTYNGVTYAGLDASAKLNGNTFTANARTKSGGTMAANGSFNLKRESYDIDATFNEFPVQDFLPDADVSDLTAHIKAHGHGFDFTHPGTDVDADVDLGSVTYNNATYSDLNAQVSLHGGDFNGHVVSNNTNANVDLAFDGTIRGSKYTFNLEGDIGDLDLEALKLYDGPMAGNGKVKISGSYDMATNNYDVDAAITSLRWNVGGEELFTPTADITLKANADEIIAHIADEGMNIDFNSRCGGQAFIDKIMKTGEVAIKQYETLCLDIDELQATLPQFALDVHLGPNGVVQRNLGAQEIDFRAFDLSIHNDDNFFVRGRAGSLSVGKTAIDTVSLDINQADGQLNFAAYMKNRKGTWDEFALVDINGYAKGSQLNFMALQKNIAGETGYHVGFDALLSDTLISVTMLPEHPVVGYRQWDINKNNYITLDTRTRRFEADVTLESDSSIVALHSLPPSRDGSQDISMTVDNLRLEEWTRFMPNMSKISGRLDADLKLSYDGNNFEGDGLVKLGNFIYDGKKEGDLAANAHFDIDPATKSTRVNANFDIDGSTVAVAMGALNDSTAENPFNLTMNIERLPLRKANPFIPGNLLRLRGWANGALAVTGSISSPIINGHLVGDSAFVNLPRYGSSLRLSEQQIEINNNVIPFNNYNIYGLNDRPVVVNGSIDFSNLEEMSMDLTAAGENVQFIGSEQKRYSDIFGKGFVDLNAQLSSSTGFMSVNAEVKLLPTSNITYVLRDDLSSLASKVDENMVRFVDPNDSTARDPMVDGIEASSSSIFAGIAVEQGAKINVFLSEDGKDMASIEGNGDLKYSVDFAGKDNLHGTYHITGGKARYTPPIISQKVFDFVDNSKITWNGDITNPTLDLRATSSVKTAVSNDKSGGGSSGSRLVDFLITASIANSLNNMDLNFDLEAQNDATVQNELQSMTEEQRSQAAINLLLYNTYSGMNSMGSINTNGALYSFLQSQLNNWAANSLKGIDLSFGINQFESAGENGSTTQTSYSYRLSKSLFNEKFKIVVGGEYSTDASSEQNFAQNLINDISMEYYLNPGKSRYLRLFRHTGLQSILEGEVTETGLGFVMKRKIASLLELFHRTPKQQQK